MMIFRNKEEQNSRPQSRLFMASKWLHKWIGLLLILFLIWMSTSGILINHPDLISGLSVPRWLVPKHYHPHNWNRSMLTSAVYSEKQPELLFVGGKQGIWKSEDSGKSFKRFTDGLADSRFLQKTKHLYLNDEHRYLLSATDGGLFINCLDGSKWKRVALGTESEKAVKIIKENRRLLVFTESAVYESKSSELPLHFSNISIKRTGDEQQVTLVDLFFHLHDGRVWGFPGKLLFDLAGLIIIFLCVSAFYIWYIPSKWKNRFSRQKLNGKKNRSKAFKIMFKYHLKLGIWFAVILLIIGGTGFFMRPPMLAAIAEGSISSEYYPGFLPDNPWHEKIQNVLYDHVTYQIIITTSDGQWSGPSDFSKAFIPFNLNAPLFVMGATVLETYGNGGYLIGSFNGLYHLERTSGNAVDLITGNITKSWSNVRPGEFMVTSYFNDPDGNTFINTHAQGLLKLTDNQIEQNTNLPMPDQLSTEYAMPLWNYLFEIHNGRFFKGILGDFYILLLPLGSLFFVLITLSGIIDWLFLKVWNRN